MQKLTEKVREISSLAFDNPIVTDQFQNFAHKH